MFRRKRNHFELLNPNEPRKSDDDELITVTTGTTSHSGHYHGVHQQQAHMHTHEHHNHGLHNHGLHHEINGTFGNNGYGADGVTFTNFAQNHGTHSHFGSNPIHGTHHGMFHGTAHHTSVSRTMTKREYRAMVRRQVITLLVLAAAVGGTYFLWREGLLTGIESWLESWIVYE